MTPIFASLLAVALTATPASSTNAPTFGAVSPAFLSDQENAFILQAGYPELRLAYRYGMADAEIGVEGGVDLFRNTLRGMIVYRSPLVLRPSTRLSLDFKGGVFRVYEGRDSDPGLVRATGLALEFGSTLSWKTDWPLALFARIRAPLDAPFTHGGLTTLKLLVGVGGELDIGRNLFLSLSGALGPEFRQGHDPRTAGEAMAGIGWRAF